MISRSDSPEFGRARARRRGPLLGGGLFLFLGALSGAVHAREYPGPGFAVVDGGGFEFSCAPRVFTAEVLQRSVLDAQRKLGLDAEIVVVLTARPSGCGDLYYVAVANDVAGIGYARSDGVERFDRSEDAALEGIAFLNDLPYWLDYPDEFRTSFLHEIGHRWGARVHALRDGMDLDLTGREGAHWSYFLDSGGSPLEGNAFASGEPVRTATPRSRLAYSPLDLYLMGLVGPDEVGPIRWLGEGTGPGLDCRESPVTAASPPQDCEEKQLSGEWLELSIDDVIASEGPRVPSSDDAPRSGTMAFLLYLAPDEEWSEAECRELSALVDERLADFTAATGERFVFSNVTRSEVDCASLVERRELARPRPGCSWTATPGGEPLGGSLSALLLGVGMWVSVRLVRGSARGSAGATRR